MIYRSNLTCPDLAPHFKHLHSRPMPHSFGHDVLSDWADKPEDDPVFGLYKKCGFWTHDEAAILYAVAYCGRGSPWVDIGCHTGWTTAHIGLGVFNGSQNMPIVYAVDPMLAVPEFRQRFEENMNGWPRSPYAVTSNEFLTQKLPYGITSGVIDGDHDPGKPLEDAKALYEQIGYAVFRRRNIVMLHDFSGRPVREAVEWLLDQGFRCRIYNTPHMVACCWRGEFTPPDHIPDPDIPNRQLRCPEFDFTRSI